MAGVKGKGGKKGVGRKPSHYRDENVAQCTSCKVIKPHEAYSPGNPRTCRECKRFHALRRSYGVTREAYAAMMKAQKGMCAICQRREPKYVDHDHKTGDVRGLLCQPCNTALGAFYDDPIVIERAIRYIAIARNE